MQFFNEKSCDLSIQQMTILCPILLKEYESEFLTLENYIDIYYNRVLQFTVHTIYMIIMYR